MSRLSSLLSIASVAALAACSSSSPVDTDHDDANAHFSSNEATLLDFTFDGEVVVATRDAADVRRAVASQMFYFVGALYELRGNARIDWVDVTEPRTEAVDADLTRIRYSASIPVAWPKNREIPATFDLVLPRRVDNAGEREFYAKYRESCTRGHDYGADSFWHDFNPRLTTCRPDDADVVRSTAQVATSPENTSDTYPEYDRLWSDGALKAVVLFGANSAPVTGDAGVRDFNTFVTQLRRSIAGATVTPEYAGDAPGPATKEVTVTGKTAGGRDVVATVILLERELAYSGPEFDTTFGELTKDADFIAYAGHSGLSKNVRALEGKIAVASDHYRIVHLQGCNTAAYLDRTLHERVATANADDPRGTKHLDLLGTVLPSYFGDSPRAMMSVLNALMSPEEPRTYNTIFEGVPSVQKIVVLGDEDNAFRP